MLKTALDAVIVMRLDGTIAGWNDVAERCFGWSFDEANGQRMSELIIPPRFRDAHECGLTHYLATGEGPVLDKHIEIHALHRDGRELPIELSITRTSQFGKPVFLGFLRDISDRREAARRQELLIGELNHRVKNLLGVVAAIAHQTARSSSTIADFETAFAGRLASMGKAHEILTAATWERAPLRRLVEELLAAYTQGDGERVTVSGPDVLLAPRHFLSISMILHELLTNAVKYGALSNTVGRIALSWTLDHQTLKLIWIESGVPNVSAPSRRGFGSRMIELAVSHELHGTAASEWRADGLALTLTFGIG
ncbi:sensor histidine kinase [Sphingomonas psychrotolerans]|uniref:sensor histidine kinase n=1 Tax=Sphingomonas psychrotolerans TaxID=1327635 RepID=UPI001F348A65|nr:HWE histidine kinase domain-containing protein [Sphingomonas psychrotolerans]